MPLSGSYFYPVTQSPNLAHQSIDMKEISSTPAVGSSVGKLYVKDDNKLYYLDDTGAEFDVLNSGGGSGTGSLNLSGTITLSGAIDFISHDVNSSNQGYHIRVSDGNQTTLGGSGSMLILSGTGLYFSASAYAGIFFQNPNNSRISARTFGISNSPTFDTIGGLMLDQATGIYWSNTINGGFGTQPNTTPNSDKASSVIRNLRGTGVLALLGPPSSGSVGITAISSSLILSSSDGSIIHISGVLDTCDTSKNYHIRSTNSHLILSSSHISGSTITISGNFVYSVSDPGTVYADVWPSATYISGKNASPYATTTVNKVGGDVWIYGGQGTMLFTFLLNTGALTLNIYYGTATNIALVAGTDFNYGADVNETAINLAAAINAHASLKSVFVATAVTSKVYLEVRQGQSTPLGPVSLTTSSSSICTITNGSVGSIYTQAIKFVNAGVGSSTANALSAYGNALAGPSYIVVATGGGFSAPSNGGINWANSTTGAGTKDVGIKRIASGVLGISNGSVGTGKLQCDGVNSSIMSLILSSSFDSIVLLSASQDFTEIDKNYHIRAVNSDLILSSSATSKITMSGGIQVANVGAGGVKAHLWAKDGNMILSGGTTLYLSGATTLQFGGANPRVSARTFGPSNSPVFDTSSGLVLDPTVFVYWVVRANGGVSTFDLKIQPAKATGKLYMFGPSNSGSVGITAQTSSLILSSTQGLVMTSCSFRIEEKYFNDAKTFITDTNFITTNLRSQYVLFDPTVASFVTNLPLAASNYGLVLKAKKIDAGGNTVTISGSSGELIDGAATYVLNTAYEYVELLASGTAWYVM